MPNHRGGFVRELDFTLDLTTDATGAGIEGGFLRSPKGELVVTTDATGAEMRGGFLRAPNWALVVEEGDGTYEGGYTRTASGALAISVDAGTAKAGFLRDAGGDLVVGTRSVYELLPGGRLSKGANIAMRNGPAAPNFDKNCWADMWHEWEWSAPGAPQDPGNWIKPQIDQALAIGCNTVHLLGSQFVREGSGSGYATPMPRATYEAQWRQMLDYVRSIGLYAYVGFGGDSLICDFGSGYGYTPSTSWLLDEYEAMARLWNGYADIIIGVDLSTEAAIWASDTDNSQPVYDLVKGIAPALSFTWSKAIFAAPTASDALPASVLDHYDFHIYYNPAATDFEAVVASVSKPVIIGEFGSPASDSTTARQARFNGVKAIVENADASGRYVAGAHVWCMYDQGTLTSDQYGLYDSSNAARTDTLPIFEALPTARGVEVPPADFAPTDLTGLSLWLQADDLALSDGAAVTSWADASGNSRAASQATGTKQPVYKASQINGLPAVRFDGTDDYLATAAFASPTAGATILAVVKPAVVNAYRTLLCHAAAATWVAPYARLLARITDDTGGGGGRWQWIVNDATVAADTLNDATGAPTATWRMVEFSYDQTNLEFFQNAVALATKARTGTLTSSTQPLFIGTETAHGETWNGDIAEVVVYDRGLDDAERAQVETYLTEKYNL